MTIRWSEAATAQLLHLDTYWSERNPDADVASAIIDRVNGLVDSLERYPRLGRPGRVDGTRELVVPGTQYIVAYEIDDEVIYILAVLHGAQRWPRHFS